MDTLPDDVVYICGQPEENTTIDPSTGEQRLHFQGFVIFTQEANIATGEEALAKLGIKRGKADKCGSQTVEKAINYTKKLPTAVLDAEGKQQWKELGEVPLSHRKVGEAAGVGLLDAIKRGASYADILELNPTLAIRCPNGVEKAINSLQKPAFRQARSVYLIYGGTGLGKTHCIFRQLETPADIYNKLHPPNDKATDFWEGYDKQPVVLFDDFHPGLYSLRQLLQYFHEYPITLQIKGSSRAAAYNTIYITTNVHPDLWYLHEKHDPLGSGNYAALWRRIPPENRCHFVERIPDDVDITTFEELKKYQDAAALRKGQHHLTPEDDNDFKKAMWARAKKIDRNVLERTWVDIMHRGWVSAGRPNYTA
jgi:hypothetical protein